MKPVLLDLFCGAGGATKGYQRAGFYVIGVDHKPQPRYCGDLFFQEDALRLLSWMVASGEKRLPVAILGKDVPGPIVAVHASPPCQAFTTYRNSGDVRESPDLIAPTRELLIATGLPYVIENVVGAPLIDPVLICGSMFDPPMDIRRHRLFETNWPLQPPVWPCRHKLQAPNRFPGGRSVERTGRSDGPVRNTVEVGAFDLPLPVQREAMGIDWMNLDELSQAIPPAYTEHIGHFLLEHLRATAELAA